ncbi:4Fe-4S binding protein [candidate division WOR-3 bacterium]|nr:4Fe-4S binding protein [candidate division WOR-3 bacterium]
MKETWKELPIGCIIEEGGTSRKFKTGDWRSERAIFSKEKCTNCLLCYIYCPDDSIIMKNDKVVGIDYDFCKGCGICAKICKAKAIEMKPER